MNRSFLSRSLRLGAFIAALASLDLSVLSGAFSSRLLDVDAPRLRLYVFDCGTITTKDAGDFSDGGEYSGQAREFTVRCYLVRHPKGDLQWDTGLSDGSLATARRAA